MRQHIDLAVLGLSIHKTWFDDLLVALEPGLEKIKLHRLNWEQSVETTDALVSDQSMPAIRTDVLSRAQIQLRRYDALMLPVSLETLGWTRQTLASVPRGPSVPLVGVLQDLRSAAILDLLALGLTDFITATPCPQAFRARIIHAVARTPRTLALREPESVMRRMQPLVRPLSVAEITAKPVSTQAPGRLAVGSTSQSGCAGCAVQVSAFGWPDQGFGPTKQRMINLFERQYLKAAMLRANGNITLAASKSRKNRRAFWELLRKYGMATGFAMNGHVPLDKLSLDPARVKSNPDTDNRDEW